MSLSRRELLKLAGLLGLGLSVPAPLRFMPGMQQQNGRTGPNVLILVFDAFSGRNLSLYGYPRKTTPNIDRLAERATVYHNHVSGGNYTVTGTACLLSGQIAWHHRAFQRPSISGLPDFPGRNLFKLFPDYNRMTYTHNPLADVILEQFAGDLDEHLPLTQLFLNGDVLPRTLFKNDLDIATLSWLRTMKEQADGQNYSLFLSRIYQSYIRRRFADYEPHFPRGLPYILDDNFYILETAIDWVRDALPDSDLPFLGYFHFYPPHEPYNTRSDFVDTFLDDGYSPLRKPWHVLDGKYSEKKLHLSRRMYDEFILYADQEFGRLFDALDESGVLENTWVILTSDHGEMFERGVEGHGTLLLSQPVIQVPLLIFAPGQTERRDVYDFTSSVDLLPTILALTGNSDRLPDWADGDVLPPFRQEPRKTGKEIISIVSPIAVPQHPMFIASTAMIRDPYKLFYYYGYPALEETGELVELYNLREDPEELNDLSKSEKEVGEAMLRDLKNMIAKADEGYEK